MSSRGGSKRQQRAAKRGGQKRKAGGGSSASSSASPSNLTVVNCEGHAAKLLASIDAMRHSHPHLCDLRIQPSSGQGAEVSAHSLVMSAASPYILSKLTRWRDEQEEGGSGAGSGSLSSAASSSSSSTTAALSDTKLLTIRIPDLDASSLDAAVHFAYTGTVALDTADKEAALPLLLKLQLLDMADAIDRRAVGRGASRLRDGALREGRG